MYVLVVSWLVGRDGFSGSAHNLGQANPIHPLILMGLVGQGLG
jgi:hypothetical protein